MTTPSLIEVIELAMEQRLEQVYTALPAEVMAYDPVRQEALVQPVVGCWHHNELKTHYPPLMQVPIVFPSGGGMALTWPIVKGDVILVVFAQDDFWAWYLTGQVRVYPQTCERHGLGKPIGIPGMKAVPRMFPPTAYSPSEMVMGTQDGSMQVRVGPGGVKLGGAEAVSPVAKGDVADANWASGTAWAETVRGALSALGITVPALGATPYPINSEQAVKAKVV